MSIVIFGDLFDFPEGNAATNRVYTYAKGFTENGVGVHVICFANEYTNDIDGVLDDIHYYHPFDQKKRSKYFVVRRWKYFAKYVRAFSLLKKINKKDKTTAIICYSNAVLTHLFAWSVSRICGARLIIERSEHPFRYHQSGALNKLRGEIKFYIDSRLCSGIFCISHYLIDLYKKKGIKERKLFLVPSTVVPARFATTAEKPICKVYIGYFGSLTFKRDNVDLLIRAFSRFHHLHADVHLVLGGFCQENEKRQILNLVNELNIASKVSLLNYLSRQEVVKYIAHADILVMVRSKDLESQASYPSKLTEFLATAKPVVTVNVGEINEFLTDGVNSFVIDPGDTDALASKLDFILNNYEFARKVGQKGKELTEGVFNYNYQAKRIIGFLDSLKN